MDEPLSSLDAKLRETLRVELKNIQRNLGATILYVTHDQAEATTMADRIGVLEEGELVEIWSEHGTEVGKGMRVGDVYIGTVARVMKGMNALLVDLTGKGPPYALLQKGVDSPAMAWKTKIHWVDRPDGTHAPVEVNRAKGLLRKARKLKLLQEEYGEDAVAKCSQKQLKELMKTSELIKTWEEKHLFEANAKATIDGSDGYVRAIAYDDDTDELHVGTLAGRSVFRGLKRVDSTTDSISKVISASNGLVIEE